MSHLDEGTLHALLDGELEMSEVKEIQAHLGSCSACGTRLRQVSALLPGSDPTDLMISEQSSVIEGGVSIFVVPVRRFERYA